jgi:hypothetical protein
VGAYVPNVTDACTNTGRIPETYAQLFQGPMALLRQDLGVNEAPSLTPQSATQCIPGDLDTFTGPCRQLKVKPVAACESERSMECELTNRLWARSGVDERAIVALPSTPNVCGPCHHGRCVKVNATAGNVTAACQCFPPWVGPRCNQRQASRCMSLCSNRGRCERGTCVCDKGFFGVDCSISYDDDGHLQVTTVGTTQKVRNSHTMPECSVGALLPACIPRGAVV